MRGENGMVRRKDVNRQESRRRRYQRRRKNIEIRASEGKRVRETERESKQRGVTRVKDRARSKFNARKERDREISGEVIDILRRIETKRREEMIGSGQKVDSSR
jgi:hypothetical protein